MPPFPNPAAKEWEIFIEYPIAGPDLGLCLIRDCNGASSVDTVLRYRGATLAELLRTLEALQAERRAQEA